MLSHNAPARSPHDKPLLDKIGFENIFDGVPLLADRCCQTVDTDWPTVEFLDHSHEQPAVHVVEAIAVDA